MSMGPSEGMFAFYQAMNAMENLSDEELENFDAEDFSTYPTILTDMFTVLIKIMRRVDKPYLDRL